MSATHSPTPHFSRKTLFLSVSICALRVCVSIFGRDVKCVGERVAPADAVEFAAVLDADGDVSQDSLTSYRKMVIIILQMFYRQIELRDASVYNTFAKRRLGEFGG